MMPFSPEAIFPMHVVLFPHKCFIINEIALKSKYSVQLMCWFLTSNFVPKHQASPTVSLEVFPSCPVAAESIASLHLERTSQGPCG